MSTTTCPHCGGPIALYSQKCQYCGAAIIPSDLTKSKWISVKDRLPQPATDRPNTTDMVLTCFFEDGGKAMDGERVVDIYGRWFRSAFYQFDYGQWYSEITNQLGDKTQPTHWQPLISADSPEWISIEQSLPEQPGNEFDNSSANVLVCYMGPMYEVSITSALLSHSNNTWFLFVNSDGKLSVESRDVTHWMPLPTPPVVD